MSIYEEFMNFLQKEFGVEKKLPKPLKGGVEKSEKIIGTPPGKGATFYGPGPMKPPKEKRLSPHLGEGVEALYGNLISPAPKISKPSKNLTKGGVGSGRKAGSGSKLPKAPKIPKAPMQTEIYKPEKWEKDFLRNLPVSKGGVGSGRKAGSSSKLAAPKRGSPIKVAISRYQKRPSPSLHQKVVEAFRGKERKKEKVSDPLKELKHPWD